MAKRKIPTEREGQILAILVNSERYGLEIKDEYEKRTGEKLPLGSLYVTLERMQNAGFIKGTFRESAHERGGNRRKYFRLTAQGHAAFDALGAYLGVAHGRVARGGENG